MDISLDQFLQDFPGMAFCKNSNYEYIRGSRNLARIAGLSSPKKVPGMQDYDFCWEVYADIYREEDKLVLAGEKISVLKLLRTADGTDLSVVTQKAPLCNQGKIIGIIGNTVVVNSTAILEKSTYINKHDLLLFGEGSSHHRYLVHTIDGLTDRQSQCFFYLIRGESAKQIAKVLKISPRTVECHIRKIKEHYNVSSRSELVSIAFSKGLVKFIPV